MTQHVGIEKRKATSTHKTTKTRKPNDTKIENILGFRGSFTADIFFQSFGVIALLIPFSLVVSGINIFLNKKIFLIIKSIFYSVLYSLLGSLFFSFFYPVTFKLYANGNGGFVGKYLEATFLNSIININSQIFYYIIFLLILVLFLISIQFKINSFYKLVKKIIRFLFSKKEKNYTHENEIISEFIPQEEIKSLIQEDLPFIKSENKTDYKKVKFKLPSIDLLKIPTQKDREKLRVDDYIDSEFLEKILLLGLNIVLLIKPFGNIGKTILFKSSKYSSIPFSLFIS